MYFIQNNLLLIFHLAPSTQQKLFFFAKSRKKFSVEKKRSDASWNINKILLWIKYKNYYTMSNNVINFKIYKLYNYKLQFVIYNFLTIKINFTNFTIFSFFIAA